MEVELVVGGRGVHSHCISSLSTHFSLSHMKRCYFQSNNNSNYVTSRNVGDWFQRKHQQAATLSIVRFSGEENQVSPQVYFQSLNEEQTDRSHIRHRLTFEHFRLI